MRRHAFIAIALSLAATAAHAQSFRAVWVAGPADVWGAGSSGLLMHGAGGQWTPVQSGVSSDLRDIWGSAPTDIWIVGEGSAILRWNGSGVTRVTSPASADWIAVHGCNANDVYVLGQSEDDRQPPPLWRWNGSAWSQVRLPVAFRAAEITGTCGAVTGTGGGGLTIAGTAFFDPRPDQRRNVGVIARLGANGQWTTQGWNGQSITDPVIGGTGWTGVASNGTVTLLSGGDSANVLMISSRTGWTRLPPPPAPFERAIVTADGSPVLVMRDGFARFANGQWRMIGGQPRQQQQQAGGNEAEVQRIQARMATLAQEIQQRGAPTQAQMQEIQTLQTRYMQLATGSSSSASMEQMVQRQTEQSQELIAAQQRLMSLQFGDAPAVMAARTGSDFWVATANGTIYQVSGDASTQSYSYACAQNPQLCPQPAAAPKPANRPRGAPARRP